MTVSSFCRYFKKETNYTFTNYVNKIRIDFSKKLLTNTNFPIKEIGFECGYNSVPYFNKQFKKIEGFSPFGSSNKKSIDYYSTNKLIGLKSTDISANLDLSIFLRSLINFVPIT